MKILHLGTESPFVDFLVSRFERVAPGANELVVVSQAEEPERSGDFTGPRTWLQRPRARQVEETVERGRDADLVVAHAMTGFAALVCTQLPPHVRVLWSGFGFDYYLGASGEDLAGPLTRQLLQAAHGGREPDRNGRMVLEGDDPPLELLANDVVRQYAATRADYFSAPVDADLEVFTRAFPGFRGRYRQVNYGDVATTCRGADELATGSDILVGNSASWPNNHAEAFRTLAQTDLGDRRVVVPLTYGDPAYRDAVLEEGAKRLGKHFHPIVDHLPIDEYLALISSCGVALFQHRRQQALGNILAALYQGSTVYLDRRNPLFTWFRSHGVRVQPARTIRDGLPEGPVSPEVLARHRAVIEEHWSTERVEANIRALLDDLAPAPTRRWRPFKRG